MKVGAYPGTFDPPTIAHLAIAEAAWRQGGLDRLDLVICESPLGKKDAGVAPLDLRMELLAAVCASRPWLSVAVNESELIADIAKGYDAIVLGGDKWAQVTDPAWYGDSATARDEAVERLPRILLAPRGSDSPTGLPSDALVLSVDPVHLVVSASDVRAGRLEWLPPEIASAWSPP